jgi:hypothetical protein
MKLVTKFLLLSAVAAVGCSTSPAADFLDYFFPAKPSATAGGRGGVCNPTPLPGPGLAGPTGPAVPGGMAPGVVVPGGAAPITPVVPGPGIVSPGVPGPGTSAPPPLITLPPSSFPLTSTPSNPGGPEGNPLPAPPPSTPPSLD